MGNNTLFSILLVAVGLLVGFIIAFILNNLRVSKAAKEADNLINQAKKDIEKFLLKPKIVSVVLVVYMTYAGKNV